MDTLLVSAGGAKYNQVGYLFMTVLEERLKVSKSLATSDPEEHFLHALHFVVLDGTSDELQSAVNQRLINGVLGVTTGLSGAGTFKVVHHLVNEVDDLVVIL